LALQKVIDVLTRAKQIKLRRNKRSGPDSRVY
jgi:hypothetical protein